MLNAMHCRVERLISVRAELEFFAEFHPSREGVGSFAARLFDTSGSLADGTMSCAGR